MIGLFNYFFEKKNDGKPDPGIKSLSHPVGTLKELLKYICNLKG